MLDANLHSAIWSVVLLVIIVQANLQNSTEEEDVDGSYEAIQTRVTNGDVVTDKTAYPSFVFFPDAGCGGTLISSNLILTAAHCLKGLTLNQLSAVAGTVNNPPKRGSIYQKRKALRAEFHPDFNKQPFNLDVGIVQVCPFEMNENVGTLSLLARALSFVDRYSGIVVGFGFPDEISITEAVKKNKTLYQSDKLRQARQRIIGPATCKRVFKAYANPNKFEQDIVRINASHNLYPRQKTQICGLPLKSGQSKCQGDSGGPLYCDVIDGRKALCGIVCGGTGCGIDGIPGVYTSFYSDEVYNWIVEAVARKGCPRNSSACQQLVVTDPKKKLCL